MKTPKIPEATIMRLSVYSRYLSQLEGAGITTVSSDEIADGVSGTPAQVRKDLAYFGEFGTRGVGYNVADLNKEILKILGLSEKWNVIIIGAGNLGSALAQYKGFQQRGFCIKAIFDNDPTKVGLQVSGVPIYPIKELADYVSREQVKMAIIAVPASSAQEAVNLLVETGIKAILNFAPKVLNVPESLELRNVDLAVNLEVLTYNLEANKNRAVLKDIFRG